MKVNARLEDISDGKLYDMNDMVKADTRGCGGCSACCHGVGSTIVLNPFDMYQILTNTGKTYDELMDNKFELHKEEKITLPNLKMLGESEACGFLDDKGRCSIHAARPGICRLFPLGRYYEGDDFKYFFKTGECIKPNLSKVKVKKWIGINHYAENKKFILSWHGLLKALKFRVKFIHDEKELIEANAYLMRTFYQVAWEDDQDFYTTYYDALKVAKDKLGIL